MVTLTLDLGTHTGWALVRDHELVGSGTLHLATDDELELQRQAGRDRTLDLRFGRLHDFVTQHVRDGVNRIVFEDVEFASTRMQTQLWASLRSSIWAAALIHPAISIFGLPVATLKQFATGNGHVQKLAMAQALAEHLPAEYTLEGEFIRKADGVLADDNEIDAIWLALYTRAVDAGARSFLTVHQRKQIAKAERRQKRVERKQRAKVRKTAAQAIVKARQQAISAAIKAIGKCCGVVREQIRRKAVCPRCASAVLIPIFATKAQSRARDLTLRNQPSNGTMPNAGNTPN